MSNAGGDGDEGRRIGSVHRRESVELSVRATGENEIIGGFKRGSTLVYADWRKESQRWRSPTGLCKVFVGPGPGVSWLISIGSCPTDPRLELVWPAVDRICTRESGTQVRCLLGILICSALARDSHLDPALARSCSRVRRDIRVVGGIIMSKGKEISA